MFSGRAGDLSFDMFYSVMGSDPDTFGRQTVFTQNSTLDLVIPEGKWQNIIGAYVGLNMIENLGLSLGYTANFDAYEKGGYVAAGNTADQSEPVSFTAPVYSGIDIRANYSGIDKIDLTFNNNLSFAGVKGQKWDPKNYTKEVILDFDNYPLLMDDDSSESQNWFHWDAELKATFDLIEKLNLTFHLGNRIGVLTTEGSYKDGGVSGDYKTKTTTSEFRAAVSAEYGIGAVTVGTGLFLSVKGLAQEREENETSVFTNTETYKGNSAVTSFGIPILFKVAF
jgi:hypothetical protein